MSELRLRIEEREGSSAIVLEGELDISTVGQAEDALRTAKERGVPELVLDLSRLRFLDSTGLRFVLSGEALLREAGARLRIVPGPERVQRVFRIARLEERLDFLGEGDAGA